MGRKIVCPHCESILNEEILKQKNSENICLVCGESLVDDTEQDWVTWWYYGFKSDNGKTTCLDDKPIDLDEHGDTFFLIKEFKAPPRDVEGKSTEAKKILKTYIPGAFEFPEPSTPRIRCPKCLRTEFQLVPKRFSLLTGIATNRYDRVCNYCGKRW